MLLSHISYMFRCVVYICRGKIVYVYNTPIYVLKIKICIWFGILKKFLNEHERTGWKTLK